MCCISHGGKAFILGLTYGDPAPNPVPACPPSCPIVEDIKFENIRITGAVQAGSISGTSRDHFRSVSFTNVTFETVPKHGWDCQFANVTTTDVSPPISCSN